MSKYIPSTNNKGFGLVDDDDFEELSEHKWHITQRDHTAYMHTKIKRDGKWTTVYMHRLIMGEPRGKEVDHKDGDGLNNQRFNLRVCTHNQNQQNQHRTYGTSQYKGVAWHEKVGKWVAYIMKDGKRKHLGYRDSEIECAKLYDEKAVEMFGEFAQTNLKETNNVAC